MRESWARVGWRIGPNQFFRRSRQLPDAITFDPELRLMRGLRLREALIALFLSISHEIHGFGGVEERLNMRTAMVNGAWMLDGATKDRVYALSLASRIGLLLNGYVLICMLEIDENNECACMLDCGCGHGPILFLRIEGLHEMGTVMDGLSPRGEIMRGMRL
ncbi:hypothetical protein PIB30_062721 [Stylosanthes scabra]|uniref:Uncharacterized protein n=1 Tax=Stylosanthes scabra TaxID=79078 RepID=A0ABU6VMY9_9FABA|nr:hypothetical protein [Stylosanthes scabra]